MKICLIGGTGRSGTTVVSRMFARHPDLADVPEWRFLIDPDGIIDFLNNSQFWSPYHYDLHIKRLNKLLMSASQSSLPEKILRFIDKLIFNKNIIDTKISSAYSGISASINSPLFASKVRQLIKKLNQFQYRAQWIGLERGRSSQKMYYHAPFHRAELVLILRNFLLDIMHDVIRLQGKFHYLEKNTWNILWFDRILEILPEAKMLHIFRDPRDVVASFINQTWMPSSTEQSAIIYRDLFLQWQKVKANVPLNSFLECSLEQLVKEPEATCREICCFWGLDYHSKLIKTDLSKANSGRWKKEFSKQDILLIEEILQQPLTELGYLS